MKKEVGVITWGGEKSLQTGNCSHQKGIGISRRPQVKMTAGQKHRVTKGLEEKERQRGLWFRRPCNAVVVDN